MGARYQGCVESPGFQVRTAQAPPSRRNCVDFVPKSLWDRGIHCKTKQSVEDGDEPVYSSGSTQTPGEDEEHCEEVSSSSSSFSSPQLSLLLILLPHHLIDAHQDIRQLFHQLWHRSIEDLHQGHTGARLHHGSEVDELLHSVLLDLLL